MMRKIPIKQRKAPKRKMNPDKIAELRQEFIEFYMKCGEGAKDAGQSADLRIMDMLAAQSHDPKKRFFGRRNVMKNLNAEAGKTRFLTGKSLSEQPAFMPKRKFGK